MLGQCSLSSSCSTGVMPCKAARRLPIEKRRWLCHRRHSWVSSRGAPDRRGGTRGPLTEIVRYQLSCSARRHFERLESFRAGVLAISDALWHFIPVFGKGMSVAAQEAVILDRLLAEDVPMKRLASLPSKAPSRSCSALNHGSACAEDITIN